MKNNQLLPFERNRYYAGKMLTSSDFMAEQTYFNNKRRFVNNVMFGSGVVCGCGVVSLDDLSILVESGVAIDDFGREIVIESSVVKKLSAVEGYDGLAENQACLCVRYQEEDVHSVYSVNAQESGREYEFNRINEGYELFLMDAEMASQEFTMEDEFFLRGNLYEGEEYRVELVMPMNLCAGKFTKIQLVATKLSQKSSRFSFECTLQMPVMTSPEGEHEMFLQLSQLNLSMGEQFTREYWVRTQEAAAQGVDLVVKSGSGRIWMDEKEMLLSSSMPMKVSVVELSPDALVSRELGKISLEMRGLGYKKDYIVLAEISMVRTDSAYLIDAIREDGIKHYIAAPSAHQQEREYLSFFESEERRHTDRMEVQANRADDIPVQAENQRPMIATGIVEIPLGEGVRRGEVRYSGEIMHGLGKGNVYVDVGYEYFEEDPALGANSRSTIYGDPDLFGRNASGVRNVETAVKVLNDKGSFVVAACPMSDIDFLVLTYRWVAIKFPTGGEPGGVEDTRNKSITAMTPTVVLGTRDTYYFAVEFHGMAPVSLTYEMTESNSGEITPEGVYTAPVREGVYEVRIYCTDTPAICTYAYAIVKKKGMEDE